jgi:hypothetical protein
LVASNVSKAYWLAPSANLAVLGWRQRRAACRLGKCFALAHGFEEHILRQVVGQRVCRRAASQARLQLGLVQLP